jgi:hypothetical protein
VGERERERERCIRRGKVRREKERCGERERDRREEEKGDIKRESERQSLCRKKGEGKELENDRKEKNFSVPHLFLRKEDRRDSKFSSPTRHGIFNIFMSLIFTRTKIA